MSTVVAISASTPHRSAAAVSSAAAALLGHVLRRVARAGHTVRPVAIGDLDLDAASDRREFADAIETADGLIVVSAVIPEAMRAVQHLLAESAVTGKPMLCLSVADGGIADGQPSVGATDRWPTTVDLIPGGLVPIDHLTVFADGGVVIDPASARPVTEATTQFLNRLNRAPVHSDASGRSSAPVSSRAGDPDLQVRRVSPDDPALRPLLDDLMVEYGTRYGGPSPNTELTEVPASDFVEPHGVFLLLLEDGQPVAGGALRRYDDRTAEVKRVWTAAHHRRRGLGRRLMAELEQAALDLGYSHVYLTTGPRQPEARELYLATGYEARFDQSADPETIGPLPFHKALDAAGLGGAGLDSTETQARLLMAGPAVETA